MITNVKIRNLKRFEDVEIELGSASVLIGPNNSGKTTALQALSLWDIGLKRWYEKRGPKEVPDKRPGVTINRRDLIALPTPRTDLLWRNLHIRDSKQVKGKQVTKNIRIDIIVEGQSKGKVWKCGLEFDYANQESFYCRPLRLSDDKSPQRMIIPKEASDVNITYLPPMSGLAAMERKLEPGTIDVLIGEGRTAEVLRNLCYQVYEMSENWQGLVQSMKGLFGVTLKPPHYIKERGEISMTYQERSGTELDLSSAGRGLQQTLLLLAHLYAKPGTVLLLDEPDAHLEILRQREIYQLITRVAKERGSQVVCASHSEVILQEAANRDVVIAFVGRPHRIDDRGSQVLKSLRRIDFDQYYQAEQTGWVLYLEGATDLAILKAFAETLGHKVAEDLVRPFVHYVSNQSSKAADHFFGLEEAKSDLVGIALYDRLDAVPKAHDRLIQLQWKKTEIENYLCQREVLFKYATGSPRVDMFEQIESERRVKAMTKAIDEVAKALETLNRPSPWSGDLKVSDEFLDPLFEKYFRTLKLPNSMRKTNYHVLATLVEPDQIDPEVSEKLDAIVSVAKQACPGS